jgi:hypothetical protein
MDFLVATTITVSLTALIFIILGVAAYFVIGALVAGLLAIETGGAFACFFLWPLVLVFFGLCYIYVGLAHIPQLIAGDICRCSKDRLYAKTYEGEDGVIRCTRCGYVARPTS